MKRIDMKTSTFERTESGKSWKSKASDVEEKVIDDEFYRNMCDEKALAFFRRLGGSEVVERGYTCAGYLMVKLMSTSPSRDERIVREFTFRKVEA